MHGRFAPLAVGGYRRLLASYVVNQLGDAVAIIALSVLVYDRSGSAVATAALFVAMKFLPAFAAPALVARVDQYRIDRVLPVIYSAEAAVFALLAVLTLHYSFAAVLVLALIDGTLALTARGLTRGAVAGVLTPAGLLREGNALMNVGFGLSVVVGMAAGGLIVSGAGAGTGLLVDATSFGIVAVFVAGLGGIRRAPEEFEPFKRRLLGGLGHVRRHPVLRMLLAGQALALMFFYLIIPIEVIYAKETLGAGDAGFGALMASWSGGILIGSLGFVGLAKRSPAPLVIVATGAIGLAYGGMAMAGELWLACALSVFGGVGNGFQWVSVMTLLQEATPSDLQARVAGLLESVGAAMPGVGFVAGGALTALSSPRTAYAVAGVGVLAVVVLGALLLPARLRPQPRPEAPSGAA